MRNQNHRNLKLDRSRDREREREREEVVGQLLWKAFVDFYVRLLNYINAYEDIKKENVVMEENT